MLWTQEDVRRIMGMLAMGMSLKTALLELGLSTSDMVINLRRMARPKIIEDAIDVPSNASTEDRNGRKRERGMYTLFDLAKGMSQCRFSMGHNGQHLFCGDPVSEGKGPWCKEHRAVVFEPPRTRRVRAEAAPHEQAAA
jgi:hypothetical protein